MSLFASAADAAYGLVRPVVHATDGEAAHNLTLAALQPLPRARRALTSPVLATELGLNDTQAGFLIGASIHDVAQAIGGGYAFSDAAGASATIVKLARVALLAPVVAWRWRGRQNMSPGRQLARSWAMWRAIAFHRRIWRASSSGILRPR